MKTHGALGPVALLTVGTVATALGIYGFFDAPTATDFYARYQEGLAWRMGAPLYQPVPSVNMHPPWVTWLVFAPLSRMPLWSAQAAVTAANLIAFGGSLLLIRRALSLTPRQTIVMAALVSISHGMFQHWWLGQFTGVLMYPMTQAWLKYRAGRFFLCGAWLATLIAIKPPFALVALLLPWQVWVTAGSISALGSAAMVALTGWDVWALWLTAGAHVDWLAFGQNASLWGIAARWQLGGTGAMSLGQLSGKLIALVCATAVVLWIWTLKQSHADRRFACANLLSVLVSPLGWIYYLPVMTGAATAVWERSPLLLASYAINILPLGPDPHDAGVFRASMYGIAVLIGWTAMARPWAVRRPTTAPAAPAEGQPSQRPCGIG